MTISKTKIAKSLSYTKASSVKQIGLAAAFMLSATNVHALGLGSLEIDSNLDQPLNGQIELRTADGDDIDSVTAAIASEEEFESLGIDYPSYLKDISLSVNNNGSDSSLNVSSNGVVIKEPFIHFLVRVEWSGGSFLREYTALIDPPVYAAASPQSLAEPRVVGTDQSYSSDTVDTPDASDSTYDEVLSDDTDAYEADVQDDEVAGGEPLIEDDFYNESTEAGSPEQVSDALGDARYGPVESGESLSLIASDLQAQFPDLSIYQIMKVLFDENESAFIGGNINGLIKGSILNIGDLNIIRAVDVAESKEFYITQVNEWDPSSLISPSAESVNVGQDDYIDSSDDYSFDSISDSTPESERFQVGASTEEDNYVSSDQGANRDGEVLALRQEISQLETSLASSELEKQDLNERISLLEGQLSDMNRLVDLNVESSELAALESNLKDQNDDLASDEELSNEESAIDEFLTGTEESADELFDSVSDAAGDIGDFASDSSDALQDAVDETGISEFVTDIDESGEDLIDSTVDGVDSAADGIESVVDDAVSVIETSTETKPAKIVKPETSILDTIKNALFGSGLWKVLAGLGALIIAGLGILFLRNRRADEEFEISMLSIESNSQSVDDSDSMSSATHSASMSMSQSVADDDAGADKETSFLTVYSDSDAVVQADEVDPVAEADVYIAYGRDEQAEEVLLDGVVSHPDRIDIKHKLLSLYFKRQNVEGFERVAEELYSQRASLTGDTWQQISQMGKEIAPHNPLFELDGNDLSTAIEANSELQLEGDNIDEVTIEAESDDEVSLTFNSENSDDLDEVMTVGEESEMIVNSLDNDDSIQLVNFEDGRSQVSELDDVDMDVLDFGEVSDNKVEVDEELVAQDLSSDLPELSLDDDENVLEFDIGDDAGLEANDDAGEMNFSDSPEVSDLEIDADYDEARTQYELAKVFVDLGDEDGARKILDELVISKETSEAVLADSQKLLDSINS
jgi:pilus assembly protein FimV